MTEAQTLPVEVTTTDLKWIAQTVHQAYHAVGYWSTCDKGVCAYITRLLDFHDRRAHEAMGCQHPLPCPDHGLRITHSRPHDPTRPILHD